MKAPLAIVAAVAFAGCGADPNIEPGSGESSLGGGIPGETEEPDLVFDEDLPEPVMPSRELGGSACQLNETRECTCMSAEGVETGIQSCIDPGGEWSACGCAQEWPYIGPTCDNGRVECLPLSSEVTEFSGDHCCTLDNRCGLGNTTAFGTEGIGGAPKCVERFSNPEGQRTEQCGETIIPFVDTADCCREDGKCGLYLNYNNWHDLGCIERTELATLLKGSGLLNVFLTFVAGDPGALDRVASDPKSCTFEPDA